jgi:phosphoglycolate phosphatase
MIPAKRIYFAMVWCIKKISDTKLYQMIDILATMKFQRYKNIIFDLDGTITDSKEGILNSLIYSLSEMGMEIPSQQKLLSCIGTPLQNVFHDQFGLCGKDIDNAVFFFRKYYGEKGIFENRMYDGMEELLTDLSENSSLYIATSKLEKFAIEVLKHFGIHSCFKGITGADAGGNRAEKTFLVKHTIVRYDIESGIHTVMIGDTWMDIHAAKKCGIQSIAVTYGYGTEKEISESNPDYIASGVGNLRKLLV